MFYELEFQTTGAVGSVIPTAFASEAEAYAKHHTVMAAAEISEVEKHGSMIIDENLNIIEHELGKRAEASQNLPVFFALEFQTDEGVAACIPMAYADKPSAWEKYYDTLRYASKISTIAKHGAMIITSDLFKVADKLAERTAIEPEPEPVES